MQTPMRRRTTIICCWLFDQTGRKLTYGGSQRYTVTLARLLADQGWDVRILQKATQSFSAEAFGIPVEGVPVRHGSLGMLRFSHAALRKLSPEELVVYVYLEAAFPQAHANGIAVQHGLNWSADNRLRSILNTWVIQKRVLSKMKAVVCVDTAYINWAHACIPGRSKYAQKLHYVPNFVENKFYEHKAQWKEPDDSPVILFPRRMEEHRGCLLFTDAMERLWNSGRQYKAVFCGGGTYVEAVRSWAHRLKASTKIIIKECDFQDMPRQYSSAQVAVVPTLAFEGTAFSCIEAMASGLPVVTTHIGGLCNLVVPGHNGLCCDLSPAALAESIDLVLHNRTLWQRLSAAGTQTAAALDHSVWSRRWLRIIDTVTKAE